MSNDDATIERVARAIYESGIPKGGRDYVAWENLDSEGFYAQHDLAMKQARAALSALPPRDELLRDALEALDRIVDFHIGDCPMTTEEIDFAKNINWQIRKTARAAADKIRAAMKHDKGEKP